MCDRVQIEVKDLLQLVWERHLEFNVLQCVNCKQHLISVRNQLCETGVELKLTFRKKTVAIFSATARPVCLALVVIFHCRTEKQVRN